MIHYQCRINYDGTGLLGWQSQSGTQYLKTIQGQLENTLQEIYKGQKFSVLGSSRTDAGVHALDQVIKISAPFFIEPENLIRGVNSLIHPQIQMRSCKPCDENFHPLVFSESKEYLYLFSFGELENLYARNFVTYYKQKLNIEKMLEVANLFVGKHDFYNFHCFGSDPKTTIRRIYAVDIKPLNHYKNLPFKYPNTFGFWIKGEGFLKQMVRLIFGTLLQVGRGKIDKDDVVAYLNTHFTDRLGPVSPPQGLYLYKVNLRPS